MGGENTYTCSLLSNPPKGVEYIYLSQALKNGQVSYSFWHKPLNLLIKLRILPLSPQIVCLNINYPFDLIHSHIHGLRISGIKVPVILSDSSSNYLYLRDYLGLNPILINLWYLIKIFMVKTMEIYDQELSLRGTILLVWSNVAKAIHIKLGVNRRDIVVIPPSLEAIKIRKRVNNQEFRILFIGTWFKRKGGLILIKAFDDLSAKYPILRLTIVGDIPKNIKLSKNIEHFKYLPREGLIKKCYSRADILVLIPEIAEGYGIVVLEAASAGMASIVSPIYALPELVVDQKTGIVLETSNKQSLIKALESLINNRVKAKKMGELAKKRFDQLFHQTITNQQLLLQYQRAIKFRFPKTKNNKKTNNL